MGLKCQLKCHLLRGTITASLSLSSSTSSSFPLNRPHHFLPQACLRLPLLHYQPLPPTVSAIGTANSFFVMCRAASSSCRLGYPTSAGPEPETVSQGSPFYLTLLLPGYFTVAAGNETKMAEEALSIRHTYKDTSCRSYAEAGGLSG